ncbi:MAG: lactate utilization protein [Candidatus Competibacteraceae bacterium]|nr:lactate utilization protein [Candidatus Competibacteraceae bacterium]
MSNAAREHMLTRLRNAVRQGDFTVPDAPAMPVLEWSHAEKIERLKGLMENMHTEVHVASHAEWVDHLKDLLRKRTPENLLFAPGTPLGETLESAWESDLPQLIPYSQEVEDCKEQLFSVEAAITSTLGAIAETGAMILWPTSEEPRLMSLVPTIHIAVLEADQIYNTLGEAMSVGRWADNMPTNALLISGPSKTADIELTLTFGVHGPKEVILFILDQ